ncbi:MAG: serine O-acetyltransferase [Clostridiales bacterium]|nr:serine O-acetyltransferase [Clostridiales bacterium]
MGLINDAKQIARRDPAARSVVGVIFMYSGFHALVYHKVSHFLFTHKLRALARWNSQFARFMTGIEIHPGATIGDGLFIDHGMGIVIGETAVIGDNCTIYHNVTLGGRGHAKGEKRHPSIGNNVLVGAGAKILGPVTIGDDSNIGANAVILHDVPAGATVVGVPGKIVKIDGEKPKFSHAEELDHAISDDPVETEVAQLVNIVNGLQGTIMDLKEQIRDLKKDNEEPDEGRC